MESLGLFMLGVHPTPGLGWEVSSQPGIPDWIGWEGALKLLQFQSPAVGCSGLLQALSLDHFQGWGIPTCEHPGVGKECGQAERN